MGGLDNVALGGLDPLSCITPEGEHARPPESRAFRSEGCEQVLHAEEAVATTSFRYGRADSGCSRHRQQGEFDSVAAEDAAPASEATDSFVQFAGSDALALGTGRLQRPLPDSDGPIAAAIVDGSSICLAPA